MTPIPNSGSKTCTWCGEQIMDGQRGYCWWRGSL